MERYTKRLEDGQAVMDCANCSESWNTNPDGKCTALYCRNRLKDRLAAVEDILGDEYDLDRLRELAEADREGRCVVLPIKIPGWGWYCNSKFPNAISAYFDYPSQVVDCMEDYVLRETKEEAEAALAKIATDCD